MNEHGPNSQGRRWRIAALGIACVLVAAGCAEILNPDVRGNPPPPAPEPIAVRTLPLPPTAPTAADGSVIPGGCTNPTGCMSPADTGIEEGPSYAPDGEHVALPVVFDGAPAGSVYTGSQVVLVKTTPGATFPNGDAWKCITCGVPAENQLGRTAAVDHPQPFPDGTRVLVGANVLDCGGHPVASDACTPAETHIYPLRWNVTADGSGGGGSMRELRLSPDGVTLGWNHLTGLGTANIGQLAYVGQLTFDAAPTTGTPLAPRYDLTDVFQVSDLNVDDQSFTVDPKNPGELRFNPLTRGNGELRGFTSDGREVIAISNPAESNHVDVFATNLTTGAVRRLTRTEYTDPIKSSPDDKWFVDLDVHVTERSMFVAGMDGLPPVNDLITIAYVSGMRNNRNRRFFQPMLVDRYGQRGSYVGQQLNAGDTSPGGINDPNWNARADPTWSPDGTHIVYWQALVTSPSCGGTNPLPCPASTEPGGRRTRLMIADLTSRKPLPHKPTPPAPVVGGWATPYVAGTPFPTRPVLPTGTYTLRGTHSGTATIQLTSGGGLVTSVAVQYSNYSNDGYRAFNGSESVARGAGGSLVWQSNITMSGKQTGTKVTTGPDGTVGGPFTVSPLVQASIFQATGTLTTTIDGQVFTQPANGT